MDTSWKNRLQEYCQKNKLLLPSYRIIKQSGPTHSLKFQVEVQVNGKGYVGDDFFLSKKDAEQSASSKAWEAIHAEDSKSISAQFSTIEITPDYSEPPPPPYSEVVKSDSIKHLPPEYADIERYVSMMVEVFGGRIRKIWSPNVNGEYKFEITGAYRYCENIQKHHTRNQIYFIVDPVKKTYYQKCHTSQCFGFQSKTRNISIQRKIPIKENETNTIEQCPNCQTTLGYDHREECERCAELFCEKCVYKCDYCHDAIHCQRCLDLCLDCHNSEV